MKKFFFIVILLVAVCPVSNANDFMSKALNSWMGYSINDLINAWGYPSEEKKIAGRHLVYWTNNQYQITSTQYGIYGGETYCNKIFEIDKNNKIISWQYKGNSCPHFYFTGKELVNPLNDEWKTKKQLQKTKKAERKRAK